jgi:hypothetical protein
MEAFEWVAKGKHHPGPLGEEVRFAAMQHVAGGKRKEPNRELYETRILG